MEDIKLLDQFISTQNVWLQQTGTAFTQTGSTTPSIVSGTVLFINYNIVNYVVSPVLYTYLSNSIVKANVKANATQCKVLSMLYFFLYT